MAKLFGRIREVEAAVYFETVLITKETIKSLVALSPVWTGAYVKSHNIGIVVKDRRHEPVARTYSILTKLSVTEAMALKKSILQNKKFDLMLIELGHKIIISNSIPYANKVEYIGWQLQRSYFVYSKTKILIKNRQKQLKFTAEIYAKQLRNKLKKRKVNQSDMRKLLL